MKKLILLSLLLASCTSPEVTEMKVELEAIAPTASAPVDSIIVSSSDSVLDRMNTLIHSTENVGKKVVEIKVLKKENLQLKQELVETKSQLEEVKAIMADTSADVKKKKRTFLQKIVDTIKKDTIK